MLTYKQAFLIIDDLATSFSQQFCIPFDLTNDMSVEEGTSRSDEYGVHSVFIGVKEFADVGFKSDQIIDDYRFMSVLVSIYHERHHIEQFDEMLLGETELSKFLCIKYFADLENPNYYLNKGMTNYFTNPVEIDAELSGMIDAYEFCSDMVDKTYAENMLCNYVNHRISNNKSAFISFKNNKFFCTSDEIFQAMTEALCNSLYSHRDYDYGMLSKVPKSQMEQAAFVFTYRLNGDYVNQFLNEKDGFRQDKMLASICLGQDSHKHLQSRFGSIRDMDLSLKTVFQKPKISNRIQSVVDKHKTRVQIAEEMFGHIEEKLHDDEQYHL